MRALTLCVFALTGCGGDIGSSAPAFDYSAESACTAGAVSRFVVGSHPVGPAFVGFGAQYNQNLHAAISRAAGITEAKAAALEAPLASLSPEHVRIFFDSSALTDSDLMQSFVRTVELAERSGATVNITFWHGPYPDPSAEMKAFADVLYDLVSKRNLAAVQFVTIQNEVNSTKVTFAEYEHLYRLLDSDLHANGIRHRLKLIGGDLLLEDQADWFSYLGRHMSDVLDGYSVHIYWDYRDTNKLVSRLTGVRALVEALPVTQRKPLYVTEFGVTGVMDAGEAAPGHIQGGGPVEGSALAAMQQAWFDILAARLGYVATVRWDAYYAMYDHTPQHFTLIDESGRLNPGYHLLRMLSHVVDPGWHAVDVTGNSTDVVATAFEGAGQTSVLAVNTSTCTQTVHLEGLARNQKLYFIVWNSDGKGELVAHARPSTGSNGSLEVSLPARAALALSTRLPGLGL